MTSAARKLPELAIEAVHPLEAIVISTPTINRPPLTIVPNETVVEAPKRDEVCERLQGRFAHSDIITGADYTNPATRPIFRSEDLNSNQMMELINVAEVTLKTVDYFLADHPHPEEAPADKMAELKGYLDRGMSLTYAARVETVGENRLVPQPDVIFPPSQPGSYRFQGTTLMIKNTMGGYVPVTLLIECMKQRA